MCGGFEIAIGVCISVQTIELCNLPSLHFGTRCCLTAIGLSCQLEAFQAQRNQRHKQKAAMRRQHQQPLQPLKGPATTHSAANVSVGLLCI